LADAAVHPRGQTAPLGKVGAQQRIVFRWRSPMLVWAHLVGRMKPRKLVAARIPLEAINESFATPERQEIVGSKVMFL